MNIDWRTLARLSPTQEDRREVYETLKIVTFDESPVQFDDRRCFPDRDIWLRATPSIFHCYIIRPKGKFMSIEVGFPFSGWKLLNSFSRTRSLVWNCLSATGVDNDV